MPDIEALYREHRVGLVRLVERELHNRDDAEDVVQTAFLDAQRALEHGTIPHNPRAWLAAIALNAARGLKRRELSVGALEEYAVQEASRLPEIKAAIGGLPKNEQAAVVYRELLGLSYTEMAAQMGATVPAVTMVLHRARARLRKVLGIAVPGVRPWKWLRGSPGHAAVAKAAGAVVLAGGLTTAGVVTAQRVVRAAGATMPGNPSATHQQVRNFSRAAKIGRSYRARRREHAGAPSVSLRIRASSTSAAPAMSRAASATSRAASPLPALSNAQATPPALTGVSIRAVRLPTLSVSASGQTVTGTVAAPLVAATLGVGVQSAATVTVAAPTATVTVSIP